jgi:hypothetical protein
LDVKNSSRSFKNGWQFFMMNPLANWEKEAASSKRRGSKVPNCDSMKNRERFWPFCGLLLPIFTAMLLIFGLNIDFNYGL